MACLHFCSKQLLATHLHVPNLCHGDHSLRFCTATGRDVLVSGSKDTELRVWDAVTGTCLAVAAGHVGAVAAVALSRKAKSAFVASAGADKLLKVWNLGPVMTADWSNMTGRAGVGGMRLDGIVTIIKVVLNCSWMMWPSYICVLRS